MVVAAIPEKEQSLREWLPDFFRHELAPYPGRGSLVARTVIAATFTMLVVMTFGIPYGAVGVACAFVLSRENLTATAKSAFYYILAFAIWVVLMPFGVRLLAADPLIHFFGVVITLFVAFYALKAFAYFPLAVGVVVVATGTLPIWYLPGPAEDNVELTLWQILGTAAGALITLLVEVVFRSFSATSSVTDSLIERLKAIEEVLHSYGETTPLTHLITQYAMTGTGALRQEIARTPLKALDRDRASALIGLVGYAIDIAAAIVSEDLELEPVAKERTDSLALRLLQIRRALGSGASIQTLTTAPSTDCLLLVSRLEAVVTLMEHVLAGGSAINSDLKYPEEAAGLDRLLVSDAFSNPEYLRFALAGTAAGMICYLIYVAVDWPGISTAMTTCALTALSNIGSSRQKQLLRIGGAAIGGFVFGIGSQVFVLPYLDSIAGFTILFACVTAVSAWVATSSPRLSYAGLQIAFAFYLINVSDFDVSLDLTIGRDRTVGVLLGITAMWLVFERLYPQPAAVQMVSLFARSARVVASLNSIADSKQLFAVRDQISSLFTNLNAEADAVVFESGHLRPAHLAARTHIRRWLASLRTLYLLELPLLDFDNSSRLAESVQQDVLTHVGHSLIHVADLLEHQLQQPPGATFESVRLEEQKASPEPHGLSGPLGLIWQMAEELERNVTQQPVFRPLTQPAAETSSAPLSGVRVH